MRDVEERSSFYRIERSNTKRSRQLVSTDAQKADHRKIHFKPIDDMEYMNDYDYLG